MIPNSTTIAEYGLINEVRIYDDSGNVLHRKITTEYNLNSAYVSRRIIGLPSKTQFYGREASGLNLISKTTYSYDEIPFNDSLLNQNNSSVIQHDNNFSASFEVGRGNLTSIKNWDATDSENSGNAITSIFKYNISGSVVEKTDQAGRTIRIGYTDAFNDSQNRNTFALPTKITDAAGKFSEVKYRFETGGNVLAKSPVPQNQIYGKTTTRHFDDFGRLQKETLWKDIQGTLQEFSYVRYEYPANGLQSKIYTTVSDVDNSGTGNTADEFLTEVWTDGAGRTLRSRSAHPDSTGGWTASITEYDILGRLHRSTVPTEVSVSDENDPQSWVPVGDDDRGIDNGDNAIWLWTEQQYDWAGRLTRIINSDGTDRLISYDGCGCAGRQVTTIQGELVPVPTLTNVFSRRTQKIYDDILGRTEKVENLYWDGTLSTSSIYSTIKTKFNGRDQEIEITEYSGSDASATFQTTTRNYDGFGRLKTQHVPEQDTNSFTTYNYNSDNSVSSVVDARGASTGYVYNTRGLLTNINYSVPTGSTIPTGSNISFTYDDA
ncbi:MAG TPA: hypothetical protein VGD31_10505, partial [Sphingobacteriaceae bacterium]